MAKVITFSRSFPVGHPKAGQPTYFVEKIWKEYYEQHNGDVRDLVWYNEQYDECFGVSALVNVHRFSPKRQTIRAGKHWKVGDKFSPRVWTGKPYASKQLEIAPDMEVKTVIDFEIEVDGGYICVLVGGAVFYEENKTFCTQEDALKMLAENDGLSLEDFKAWFGWGKKPFSGQMICWTEMALENGEPTMYVK